MKKLNHLRLKREKRTNSMDFTGKWKLRNGKIVDVARFAVARFKDNTVFITTGETLITFDKDGKAFFYTPENDLMSRVPEEG